MTRILFWDLEVSELSADRGRLLCVGYKWSDEPDVRILSQSDYKDWNKSPQRLLDDRALWKDFMNVYNQADLIVTYFGKGMDQKFLNAKISKYQMSIPDNLPHIDLFYTVKGNFALSRKSMANVVHFLELEDETAAKTPVDFHTWELARLGDKKALDAIQEHCRADVFLTERLYYRLRPFMRTHPRINGLGPCRYCGAIGKLTRQGYRLSTTQGRQIRLKCSGCGGWSQASEMLYQKLERGGYIDKTAA